MYTHKKKYRNARTCEFCKTEINLFPQKSNFSICCKFKAGRLPKSCIESKHGTKKNWTN